MIRGSIQRSVPREPVGLKDGGHIIMRCSCCDAQLVDIWIQMPDAPQHWKARATCPYCGDKSYVVEWDGGFAQGGIAVPNPNDEQNPFEKTRILDVGTEGEDIILFHVKAMGDGKPVR